MNPIYFFSKFKNSHLLNSKTLSKNLRKLSFINFNLKFLQYKLKWIKSTFYLNKLQSNNIKNKKNLPYLKFFRNNTHLFTIQLNRQAHWCIDVFFWLKARTSYYVNNWIYTTNHKRIAVNYFWFVILSGIVGMVLATIIRLEFAYPGVGILAGDSIQYLSIASAHGVIMVFFMIMPLLFGAFANFLLPTQLGVHDVAFPRLNSAAFWFLPGGLLMLCQLVCVDRRYQRMNCFNIREVESLLKRKFFIDLVNTHDHRTLLDKTAIGLRYKTGSEFLVNGNLNFFYNFGTETTFKNKKSFYQSIVETPMDDFLIFSKNSFLFKFIEFFSLNHVFFFFNNFFFFFFSNNVFDYSYISTAVVNIYSWIFYFINSICSAIFVLLQLIFECFHSLFIDILFFFKNCLQFIIFIKNIVVNLLIASFDYFSTSKFSFNKLITITYNLIYNTYVGTKFWLKIIFNLFTELAISSTYSVGFFLKTFFKFMLNVFTYTLSFPWNLYNYFVTPRISVTDYLNKLIYVNYDFRGNTFFYSLLTIIKITINNWFYFFYTPKLKNDLLSFKFNGISQKDSGDIFDAFDSPYRSLVKKSLWEAYSNSLLFEFFSLFYFLLNFPFYLIVFTITFLKKSINSGFEINWFFMDLFFWFSIQTTGQFPGYFEIVYNNKSFYFPNFFRYADQLFAAILHRLYSLTINFINSYDVETFIALKQANFEVFLDNLSVFFSKLADKIIVFYHSANYWLNYLSKLLDPYKELLLFGPASIDARNAVIMHNFYKNLYNNNKQYFTYFSEGYFFSDIKEFLKYKNHENSSSSRFIRFTHPIFKYDYKSGDYFPKLYKEVYSFLITSTLDLTSGLRTSPWFFSSNLHEILENTFFLFKDSLKKIDKFDFFEMRTFKLNKISNVDAFYNFFSTLSSSETNLHLNSKWISTPVLNSKFNKLFLTSSLQQRIYSNWRQLKFTREAWRCKMLASRHQRTLFRRYMNEDGVFWSIERNAKDLIPGWAMITPFSSRTRYTAVGKTDIGLMGVLLVLNSSIISGANFLVTYRYLSTLNNRKMRDARAFFTEAVMVASWMMILANPMLVIGIIMLISDRHWQTSFFDYSGGGDTVLFQHMFWFFGHPEVYVIIIPTFGFTNTMLSYYLKKRVSARASLLYSLYTIAFLGFFVWGHHMYMVGLSHTTRMLFSTLTVMISVPAATKLMHWCVTTANSAFAMELPLLFTFTFIFFFVSGGISGMCVAHTGMDVLFHDTFYVIGHFHVMLAGGAMFASFGAFYFYFPAIFGVKYSRVYAYLHYTYYLIGQLMTVIPMFWLGYAGMPRRVLDYPAAFGGWHSVISAGHMLNVAGLMAFFIMIFDSLRQAKAATRNTFGIMRYNTRLNFYIYEISRLIYIQQKALFFYKFIRVSSLKLNNLNYINFEPYESVLFSYVFLKK